MEIDKNLWKGGFLLLLAFGFYNFFNFLFQFSMARMLTISSFGILATLLSITYIATVFSESIQTVLAKYFSREKNKGKLKNILERSFKKGLIYAFIILFFYLVVSFFLSRILKIDYVLLAITGFSLLSAFLLPITRGALQGRKKFRSLGINMVSESSLKLVFSIIFVFLGLSVLGALFGMVVGLSAAFILSFFPLRDIIKSKSRDFSKGRIYNYAGSAFIITLVIVIFYNIDILIAKIFFEPEVVGVYSIASILSKIIFWGTLPISKAMFPISSGKVRKKDSENSFKNSLLMIFICIFAALLAFFIAPGLIVKIFSGKNIPGAIQILFLLGIGTSLISLANLILLYKLSINKTKGVWWFFIFVAVEALLLSYFSYNLVVFSIAFVASSAFFLWGSIILLNK